MKKLILITFVTFISVHNFGQSYHHLPDSNAKWCIKYNNHFIPPPFWWYTNYWETYYSGDTTISNREYKKIEKTEYDIFCLNTVINGPQYIGAIRDDTIHKQVFYVPYGQSNEELIYDFNLESGDTLISYLNWYEPLIVDFVDSVLISSDYHKRIVFQYYEAEIIEGIGSITGIVEELVAFEGGSHLCALYIDTTFTFPEFPCNLSATDTCLISNIESQLHRPSNFAVFPNPAANQFQIEISSELLFHHPRLEIISSMGKTCKSQILINDVTRIDLNDLISGIYIVKIYTDNKSVSSKKLIIEK